ncbi:ABC multidrug transporter [Colletotrichum karsti]|uniref:ABC multidrug transporter n=1 Tax=Colletotrichum karsti TaxID=1095194 RepID=A0A9P6HYD5_9PEZI|nr:ABC multidrug transporter [Colletotrichum karsti]KAF9873848.1 ABC multidrug transporter [Colletotrichum karsti]
MVAVEARHDGECIDNVAFGFGGSCSQPDFTAIEYKWIFWLSVATAAGFIAAASARVLRLSRSRNPSVARGLGMMWVAKLVAGAVFTGLRLGLLVVAVRRQTSHPSAQLVASTALNFTASCLLLALSPLEHFKSARPSVLACSFLFLALFYDIARCPSLWSDSDTGSGDEYYSIFRALYTTVIVIEFLVLVLESLKRRRWIAWDPEDHSPEETSSILSLGLYSWLNPLLWRGYHKDLVMSDLFPLDKAISVTTFDAEGRSSREESKGISTWQLIVWLARPLGSSALLAVLPRLCLLGFTFCQPFFLQRLLGYLSSQESDTPTASGLIAVAVLTYSGIAISTSLYWYYQERFQSRLRGYLISAIYRKATSIHHVGNGDSAAVTLMGADVERIYTGLRLMHELWANIIQITLASWLLQHQLGFAFLAPLVIVFLCFAGSFALSKRAVPHQSAWMSRVQKRIAATSTILFSIKDLRVSGMTQPAIALVQREREEEIRVGERSRVLIALSATLSQLPQALAPALAFAFGPRVLDETKAFTALSFLVLLTAPLLVVLQSLPILAASVACLRRIKLFLMQDDRVDERFLKSVGNDNEKGKQASSYSDPDLFIHIVNGSFGWTPERSVLKDINIRLPKSSITFVVGPVASGKSTLCRALLGEVPHMKGSVAVGSNKVAYCDQMPFLFNESIMENIIGFSELDTNRYAEVNKATMLTDDLTTFPAGDRTVVGTKGLSLSGGQRQRVSLARALYHDAEILILDDIFRGLDVSTQHQICQAVFGRDGLLRRRGSTAIVCTHSTEFLTVADHIIALSQDGTVADQVSSLELVRDEERGKRLGFLRQKEPSINLGKVHPDKGSQNIEGIASTGSETSQRPSVAVQSPTTTPTTVTTPTVDLAVYRHWLSTLKPLPLVVFAVLVVGVGFCANFPTIWLKMWSEDSTSAEPKHSLAFWMGLYALLGAGGIICVFPAGLIMLRTAVRLAGTDLHRTTINTIMHSSLRFLGSTDVGKVLNLFSQDMNIMDTQLPRMINNFCFCLATAIGQAAVIAVSSAWLSISYPFFMLLLWMVQRIYLPTSKRLRILDLEAKAPLYTNFLDTLSGLPTIRAFGWFPHQIARNNALLDDSQRPSYLLAMAQQWLMLTMNILVAIVAVLLVSLSTQLRSDTGNVGAGLVTLITLGGTLTTIVVAYTGLETSLGAISRLKSFEEETESEGNAKEDVIPDEAWPMSGCVRLKDVDASYDGTQKVLKELNLVIESGQKVAICGRTGSGKSSILALLLRLIDPLSPDTPDSDAPTILIDNLDLRTINRTTLRERIISASQDPVFLSDGTSFRVNLDPGSTATDEECNAVLTELGLSTIIETKGGLNAFINGAELSAGQKQLFSVARAVLRRRVKQRETGVDGGLLLLDEITSGADADTEKKVRRILDNEFQGYTVVMVTHRREMAMSCDRVLMLDAGKVAEDGIPGTLLDKQGSQFGSLWESERL